MPRKLRHPKKAMHSPHRKPRRAPLRRLYCDCGQPASAVLWVKVGSDPQYTVRLLLCPACLALEQGHDP